MSFKEKEEQERKSRKLRGEKSYKYLIIVKNKTGNRDEPYLQVYGDKFTVYDKVSHLLDWLNKHNPSWKYWGEEKET